MDINIDMDVDIDMDKELGMDTPILEREMKLR
jgi:hypothetical protein